MTAPDPAALASVLTEEVLRLLRDPSPTSETWRKVAGTADDLAKAARAHEALLRRQERLAAQLAGANAGRARPCQKASSSGSCG